MTLREGIIDALFPKLIWPQEFFSVEHFMWPVFSKNALQELLIQNHKGDTLSIQTIWVPYFKSKHMYGNISTWRSLGHEEIRNKFPWSGGWLACSILGDISFLSSELWRHDTSQRVQAGMYGYKPHRDDFQLGTKENFLKEMASWYQVTSPSQDVSKLSTQD